MRRIKDPFPPTPARFHLRVEETLMSLEERDVNKRRVPGRVALLAAILAALLALAAAASVAGRTHFRDRLDREGASEVSALVQEVHRGSVDDGSDGFRFSIDELIWEGDDLYVSYSLAVPEGGRWLVAMFTPTLDGEKQICNPRGFTAPKFIDRNLMDNWLKGVENSISKHFASQVRSILKELNVDAIDFLGLFHLSSAFDFDFIYDEVLTIKNKREEIKSEVEAFRKDKKRYQAFRKEMEKLE